MEAIYTNLSETSGDRTEINTLLDQSTGWLGEDTSQHNLAITSFACGCPSCSSINPANTLNANITPTAIASNPSASSLLSGYQWGFSWGNRTLSYSFYEDTVFNGSYYGGETGVREVSQGVKNNVRNILNWVESIINIDFVEVTETDSNTLGRMRFLRSNGPSYAYAYYPSSDTLNSVAGDIHLKPTYDRLGDTNGFQNPAGQHGYMALIHEIGHTLGLKHSHETPALAAASDNTTNTVMTYNFTGNAAGTFMPLDILALQTLYGAKAHNSGDNIYQFSSNIDQFSVNGQLSLNTTLRTKQSIWDSGGTDLLDLSQVAANTSGYRLDLNPGGILTTKAAYSGTAYTVSGVTYRTTTFGTAIAYNVEIENLTNTTSSDDIYLNPAVNTLFGYSATRVTGNDVIYNGTNLDTLKLDYNFANISRSQSGNDLRLGLGNNGSLTLKDYYLTPANPINICYSDSLLLSISDAQVIEGNSGLATALFTVNLLGTNANGLTVNYSTVDDTATADVDYIAAINQSLTFSAGETQKTIAIQIKGDTFSEANETFSVQLSNAPGNVLLSDAQGLGTILNDDIVPTLSIEDITVAENGTATLRVALSQSVATSVSVNYATANGGAIAGQDYTATTGTLTFNPGITSQTLTVNLLNDTVYEPTAETFSVNLSNVQNAVIADGQGMVTITDNDPLPAISINDISLAEGSSSRVGATVNFRFTVNLSKTGSQAISVNFATANGTASAGSDYIAKNGLLTFKAGETSKTVDVGVYRDRIAEVNETFSLNLTNATNATLADAQGVATIRNDDGSATKVAKTSSIAEVKDRLTGLLSQVDRLVGTPGTDTFVLGDAEGVYYSEAGLKDFALIKGFQPKRGDTIQLHGDSSLYELVSGKIDRFQGTGIFYNTQESRELIGIASGTTGLSLDSSAFSFV